MGAIETSEREKSVDFRIRPAGCCLGHRLVVHSERPSTGAVDLLEVHSGLDQK